MTVEELIDYLKEYDPERKVLMSADGEGNYYSEIDSFSESFGRESEENYDWEIRREEDVEDEDEYEPVLVLWP